MKQPEVEVIADMSFICSYCGADCCGSYRFWIQQPNQKEIHLLVGRFRFSEFLASVYKLDGDKDNPKTKITNYGLLPVFICQGNEDIGWADWESEPNEIQINDFKEAIEYVAKNNDSDPELLSALCELIARFDSNRGDKLFVEED